MSMLASFEKTPHGSTYCTAIIRDVDGFILREWLTALITVHQAKGKWHCLQSCYVLLCIV
jgi:hypothetical protein